MKIYTILMLFVLALSIYSCGEADEELFDDNNAFFSFETTETSVVENDIRPVKIPVSLARSIAMGDVSFSVDTEGLEYPAIEGVDFIIKTSNNTLEFNGDLIENIEIKLIDNDVRDGDKMFKIVLTDNNIKADIGLANGVRSEHLVTISDDEHPLAKLIGYDFGVYEQSIAEDEDGNKIDPYEYDVELSPVSGKENQLYVKGMMGIDQQVILEFDVETGIVEILPDQTFTDVYAYSYYSDLTFFGWEWYVKDDGTDGVRRFPSVYGVFDLEKQEIVFPDGYLLQITAPDTHPYVGYAYNIFIIEHCIISKN